MASNSGPKIVTGSMSFYIDAASKKSLTTIGNGWMDLMGNTPNLVFSGATFSAVNGGIVTFAGTPGSSASTTFTQTPQTTIDCWVKLDTASTIGADPLNMIYTVQYTSNIPTVGKVQSYLNFRSNGGLRLAWLYYNTQPTPNNGSAATYFLDTPTGLLQTKTWYNITTTLNIDTTATTSTGKIFVNGVQVASFTTAPGSTTFMNPSDQIMVANYNSDTGNFYPFNGSISNLKIYSRILTDAEIQQNYRAMVQRFQPDVAELAVLHLDAANRNSFTRVQDGWADLSTLQSTLLLSGAQYESKNGGVLTFAGTTGSFPTGSRAAGNFIQSTEMTWDVWFNRTQSLSSEGTQFNMVFDHASLPYLSFGTSNDASRFLFSWFTRFGTGTPPGGTQSQRTINTSPIYTNNTWYNVTCTLQLDLVATRSTARIYVNGVLAASQTTDVGTNDQIWPNSSTLRLATFGANSQYPFKGSISNLRVYRRILTDAEILQSYNALKARFGY